MAKLTLALHDIFNRGTHLKPAIHNILREALEKKFPPRRNHPSLCQ